MSFVVRCAMLILAVCLGCRIDERHRIWQRFQTQDSTPRPRPVLWLAKNHSNHGVDSRSGETTLLAEESSSEIADWSRDGREVILHYRKPSRLARRTLDGGSEAELYKLAEGDRRFFVGGLSPDGKTVAIARGRSEQSWGLIAASTETGEVRELSQIEKSWYGQQDGYFAWSPDSDSVYYVLRTKGRIFRVPADGGEVIDTGLIRDVWPDRFPEGVPFPRRIRSLGISPDGTQISFSFQEKSESGLWVMKDFLPKLGAAQ